MTTMKRHGNQKNGFTLLESMICVAILLIMMWAVFHQVNKAQASYRVEGQKTDMTQQEREFIDQFTRDLRQAGYPSPVTSGITPPPAGLDLTNPTIAAGITAMSPTSITMEGDIDNTGTVQVVTYSLNPAAVAPCPCIQRTVTPKGGGGAAAPYIEVQNVLVPGAQGIFLAYDANGAPQAGLNLALPAGATTKTLAYTQLHQIKSVRVTFTLQGTANELTGATPAQVTMTGMARIPND